MKAKIDPLFLDRFGSNVASTNMCFALYRTMTTKHKPVFAILVFLSCVRLQGQNVAIELNYPQAWPEIENALTIVVEGVACKHLYISTDNGSIISGDKGCSYSYIPKNIVESHLFIYNTANHDTVLIEKRRIATKGMWVHSKLRTRPTFSEVILQAPNLRHYHY